MYTKLFNTLPHVQPLLAHGYANIHNRAKRSTKGRSRMQTGTKCKQQDLNPSRSQFELAIMLSYQSPSELQNEPTNIYQPTHSTFTIQGYDRALHL